MDVLEFGTLTADTVLLQPVDEYDLKSIENEIAVIRENTAEDFRLIAFKVSDWNKDLSPWIAPAVFGKEDFGDGAADTLAEMMKVCEDRTKSYYVGGYSLAGLFALWAAYQTDLFCGIAAASPSVWFPGWTDYAATRCPQPEAVYLSLGDREEHTRNPLMRQVGDAIRWQHQLMEQQTRFTTLEWNAGNHFVDAEKRMARGFAWLMGTLRKKL